MWKGGWIQHDFKSKFNSSNNIIINYAYFYAFNFMPICLPYHFWHRLMARAQIVGHNQNNDTFHLSKGPFTLKCKNIVKLEL